jgi:hypothetical protein
MTKIETTYLWIIGITDFIKRVYIKAFPVFAVLIAGVCVVGLPDGVANGKLQSEHIPYIFAAAALFTAGVVLWFALSNKAKLESKRGYYERSRK